MKLWLWENFVNGNPEYWAFDNPFPRHLDCGDPQTLGEPCGYAVFKESRNGRPDVPEEEVLRRIAASRPETENKIDGPCTEDDGCPTEVSVLKREWRRLKQLEADNKRLREALNAIAEGEIYPVQGALAALAATPAYQF